MSGAADEVANRVAGEFARIHRRAASGIWMAPGRVNLIGEHTDYNDGFVAPLALAQRCYVAASHAPQIHTTVHSLQEPETAASFPATATEPGDVTGWAAYVAGVFWAFRQAGHEVGDVDIVVDSEVPRGAGLSSSAALECAVAIALSDLFGLDLTRSELATLARCAENDYVGAPTGVMDQLASMHGRDGDLVVMDTRTLGVRHLPLRLDEFGLALVVIDTRTRHALVDSEYADRRRTCQAAAIALGVRALRDIDVDGLGAALDRLSSPFARRRVRHVVTENARVLSVAAALAAGDDPRAIGSTLTASHVSLRDDFEVSVAQLDLAVDTALAAGAYGARMTGGGFGGSAIALIDADRVDGLAAAVTAAYERAGFALPAVFMAVASRGAARIDR
jgi:galactokinase